MKKIVKIIALAIAAVSISATSQAAAISGSIGFDGASFMTDTGNTATANAFTSFSGVEVSNGFGDYAGTGGEAVVFQPFVFDPFVANNPLWSFSQAGLTYTFEATDASVAFQNASSLVVEGFGVATITGKDPTFGTFVITGNAQGQAFSFSAGTTVPDAGAAVAYFGLGLVALVGLSARRQLA